MLAQGADSPKHFMKFVGTAKTDGSGNNPLIFFLKAAIQRSVIGVFPRDFNGLLGFLFIAKRSAVRWDFACVWLP
jgi:hypothetical protein